jgi:hypothetical protein
MLGVPPVMLTLPSIIAVESVSGNPFVQFAEVVHTEDELPVHVVCFAIVYILTFSICFLDVALGILQFTVKH